MFGTTKLPMIPLSLADFPLKAQEMTGKMSISGVQPKLSMKLDRRSGELVPTAEGGEYIIKPQVNGLLNVPQIENCCMDIAESLQIDVPVHCLLSLKDRSWAYVVKRFDRRGKEKIHQEDFVQILGKKDKYLGSYEEIGKSLKNISAVPGLDIQLFFERAVLNFIIGNGDAHLKNFSIQYLEDGSIRLSPAYDLVCSKLLIPGEEESALTLNGKRNNIKRADFEVVADYFYIPPKVRYERFIGKSAVFSRHITRSQLTTKEKKIFSEIVKERYKKMGFTI